MALSKKMEKVVGLLRLHMRNGGWTMRSVARELAWHEDYLSQLLRGTPQLKMEQLFSILGVIGLPPDRFFEDLARFLAPRERQGSGAQARRGIEATARLGGTDLDTLHGLIDARIREILAQGEEGDEAEVSPNGGLSRGAFDS